MNKKQTSRYTKYVWFLAALLFLDNYFRVENFSNLLFCVLFFVLGIVESVKNGNKIK